MNFFIENKLKVNPDLNNLIKQNKKEKNFR